MKNLMSLKQQLIDQLGDCTNATILDYGCGKGDFIELFLKSNSKPKNILAVDSNDGMVSHIKSRFSDNVHDGSRQDIRTRHVWISHGRYDDEMRAWHDDLVKKSNLGEYYFAIDLVVSILTWSH